MVDGNPIPKVIHLNTLLVEHLNDTKGSDDSDPSLDPSTNKSEEESITKPPEQEILQIMEKGKKDHCSM